jgi:4-amino-4-deoxy-L-arabinose transferase-like glycosyltransferase
VIAPPGLSFGISSPTRRRAAVRWVAVLILLLGAGFRFAALGRDARFHPDEALFATFARNAAVQGDWLLPGNLDKPPLALYASALSMAMVGVTTNEAGVLDLNPYTGEFAARLPSALAGVLWVALMMALAQRLYQRTVFTLWAGLFAALSPMAVLFGASAFTDSWMLLWMTAALWAAAGGRWMGSGVLLGLAFASKPQGLFYLPLALAIGAALHGWSWQGVARLLVGAGAVIGAAVLWDELRAPWPSWWALAASNNAPAGLTSTADWGRRAGAWLAFARGLFGPATFLLLLFIGAFSLRSLFRRPRTRTMNVDLALAAFALAYALLHTLVGFNVYDRYWLPLLPVLALLAARAGVWVYSVITRWIPRAELQFVAIALAAVLLGAAFDAGRGQPGYESESGSSFAAQPAIDAVAAWLAEQHVAAVVYDHWLGWQLDYYLGVWSDKRRVYFPDPQAMAAHAAGLDEPQPRFFPIPNRADAAPWLDALAQAGFSAEAAFEAGGITIYRLERVPSGNEAD